MATTTNPPTDSELPSRVRTLLVAPQKIEGTGALLVEMINDEPKTMLWSPASSEEWTELEQFLRAAEKIDWSEPGAHAVRY